MLNKEDKLWWDSWAETHVLMTVNFWWRERGSNSELQLHDKTYNQALEIVQEMGYREPKWYKPWTWTNGVVTVG